MIDGKTVVYTAGTWDLFHIGHLKIIQKSKKYGDILIIGVSTDEVVKSYKGAKPYIPYEQRKEIVKSLKYVDKVVKQEILHDIKILKKYKVDVTTIGSDWKTRYLEGLEWMKKHGKKVVYLPYTEGISSTVIKKWITSRNHHLKKELFRKNEDE
jgi:glycerol-3-phosphate cytidylyltransferase